MKISFLGAGNMGTALAAAASEKGNEIVMWSIEEDVVEDINNNHRNSKYLKDVKLKGNIKATLDMEDALKGASIVVFAVPSHIVRIVAEKSKGLIPTSAIIIDVAKGLEKGTNKRMSEVIREFHSNPIVAVGGPSIANELAKKIPTFVVFASEDMASARAAKEQFENDYYRISLSSDVVGVELCGTFKNIIAILAGISDGLGYGVNTKAGIISNGMKEIAELIKSLGGDPNSVNGLAGIGDTVVTCMSRHSRNRRFGELIAKGKSTEEAKSIVSQTIEGINACRMAHRIAEDKGLSLPLVEKVFRIVEKGEKIIL